MTDPSLSADELAALRRRWEQGATPQLALQLAEEHKRRSEHDLAVGVLEKALADNPSHLAVRVAAGRLRLELGDLKSAAADLEEVVERDPTHLVANKLLVRVYTGLGEPLRARDRLDLYCLLNESDPEIEELEALVPPHGLVEASTEAAGEREEAEPGVEGDAESPAEPPTDLERAPDPAPLDEAPLDLGAPPASESATPSGDEPFPGLWDNLDAAGYWHQVEDGEIFGSVSEPEPSVADSAPDQDGAPQPAAAEAVDELEAEAVDTPATEVPEVPGMEAVDAPGAQEGEQPWPGSVAAIAEPEPVHDAEPETKPETVAEAEAPGAQEAVPAAEKGRAASVTLAALYHQQGHLEEARRTYWQVLDREPSNRQALDGLARLARSGSSELTAFDLLGDELPSDPAARRRRVLEGYLARLRRGEADVV